MLAYHYSQGEDLNKAEEYLQKAGEAALRSSASSEALSYYTESLNLYLRKSGDNVDPDKMAVLERNIGRAYRYIGHHAEAVTHFDRALRYLGLVLSTNKIAILLQILMFGLDLFKFFYFPSKKRKKIPDEREDLIINILLMSVSSSGMVGQKDSKELFVQEAILTRRAVTLDLIKYPVLAEYLYNFDGYMAIGGSMPFFGKKSSGAQEEIPRRKRHIQPLELSIL